MADGYGNAVKAAEQSFSSKSIASGASAGAQAERAINMAINSEAYDSDLVSALEEGAVSLDSLKKEGLPAELQNLSSSEKKKVVETKSAERKKIQAEILELSKKREAFLVKARKASLKKDGFDDAVSVALREQTR